MTKKRKMLERRVAYYDYLGDEAPSHYRFFDNDDAAEMEARSSEGDDGPNHRCIVL